LQVFEKHDIAGMNRMFLTIRYFDFDFSGHRYRKLASWSPMPILDGTGRVIGIGQACHRRCIRPSSFARPGCDGQFLDMGIAIDVRVDANDVLAARRLLRRLRRCSACSRDGRDSAQTQQFTPFLVFSSGADFIKLPAVSP
jgi:hypothetical protein